MPPVVTSVAPAFGLRGLRWQARRQFAVGLALVALIGGVVALALSEPPVDEPAPALGPSDPAYPPCQAVGGPILC